jgi:hypothetical protein
MEGTREVFRRTSTIELGHSVGRLEINANYYIAYDIKDFCEISISPQRYMYEATFDDSFRDITRINFGKFQPVKLHFYSRILILF